MEPTKSGELDATILGYLDDALKMALNLSENDGDYSLDFIRQKLAQCSSFQEKLSDLMMKLTRLSIDITKRAAATHSLYELKLAEVKQSDEYENEPRHKKTDLLRRMTQESHQEADGWMTLRRMVSEVKEAIGERAQTMKRLDSDLRLHAKLLEMVPMGARGATSRTSYTGDHSREIDIA